MCSLLLAACLFWLAESRPSNSPGVKLGDVNTLQNTPAEIAAPLQQNGALEGLTDSQLLPPSLDAITPSLEALGDSWPTFPPGIDDNSLLDGEFPFEIPDSPFNTKIPPQDEKLSPLPKPAPSSPPEKNTTDTGTSDQTGLGDYMQVIKKWRQNMKLPSFSHDAQLEADAHRAVENSKKLGHLEHDALDQVLGVYVDNFEVLLLAWLCELPDVPGIGRDTCKKMVNVEQVVGLDGKPGSGGHAKAIASTTYTKIGCFRVAEFAGCNLK
ncbi:hypothetical protein CDD81_1076 [Ophiocordyceps australis]|uniref:SCP domain-containing protein n=1 Tax=Ophiocordyceps australis TaxID=1399860 RepID=A0A2C5Y1W9_9HYPO|nr:hypothetical protein CDD81_1076 [Ophiocordyceps australis]